MKTILSCLLITFCFSALRAQQPLPRAHAHNDYLHKRPLFDALEQGFCSVEADIYVRHGRLMIAHTPDQIRRKRTLESLYLKPLQDIIQKNGGRVYPGGPRFRLLIDFKSKSARVYPILKVLLKSYSGILTSSTDKGADSGAVFVTLTGNKLKPAQFFADSVRYVSVEGYPTAPPDPAWRGNERNTHAGWGDVSHWRGKGPMPPADSVKLREYVKIAHQNGRTVRFSGTPPRPAVWEAQWQAGVDWIHTDDLAGLGAFIRRKISAR